MNASDLLLLWPLFIFGASFLCRGEKIGWFAPIVRAFAFIFFSATPGLPEVGSIVIAAAGVSIAGLELFVNGKN